MSWTGEHRGFVVVPWAFDLFKGRRGVAGTVTRFMPVWRFPLGIPKGKGFQTSSSISWGFEGKDPTGNQLHSAWANPESDEELPGTSSAMCCQRRPPYVWSDFQNPLKTVFNVLFRNIFNFVLDGFFHILYLFEWLEIFMPHPVYMATERAVRLVFVSGRV